jgi:hypothetical protein
VENYLRKRLMLFAQNIFCKDAKFRKEPQTLPTEIFKTSFVEGVAAYRIWNPKEGAENL